MRQTDGHGDGNRCFSQSGDSAKKKKELLMNMLWVKLKEISNCKTGAGRRIILKQVLEK
jgi:hypothetical protein